MSKFDNAVSINPYFNVTDENMDACKAILAEFCDLVKQEEACLFFNFTFNGNVLCCREAYTDAAGVQAHLENCGATLGKFLEVVQLARIEVHGPADQLEPLKEGFAPFNPDYFVSECGIGV